MKYLPLLWAGLWRRPGRAVLMALQIVSAFTLFGLLQGLNSSVKQYIADTHRDRLYVNSSVGPLDPLPVSMRARIEAIPGVQHVNTRAIFGGTYQRPNQFVPVLGTDPEAYFAVVDEVTASKDAIEALQANRTGAIAGRFVMQKYGWKVGDRIVLQSPLPKRDGSRDWDFRIVGVYDIRGQPQGSVFIVANIDYVNESRQINRDTADMIVVKVADPAAAPTVALAIDNAFANSAHETRTQSEADLVTTQIQRVADLDYMVTGIIVAVFFALLFATGAQMMQSLRERRAELAVMKTVGFSDTRVMGIILVEAVLLCVAAAAVGLGIATLLQPYARKQLSISTMPAIVIVAGIAFAILLALVGSAVPAWRGLKLQVADALAGR